MGTRAPSATCLVFERDGRRETFEIRGDECTIGRGPANHLSVDRPTISRIHARLLRGADGWRVEDRGSLTGTAIEGAPDLSRPLRDGDVIRLGRFAITFHDRGAPDETAADAKGPLQLDPGDWSGNDEARTVVRPAVDFTTLATACEPSDGARLERLLEVLAGAARALLGSDRSTMETTADLDAVERREATVFRTVLDLVFEHLPCERGCIMKWDAETTTLRPICDRQGPGARSSGSAGLPFSRTIAARVVRERVAVSTHDATVDERFADGASVMELGIRSAIGAPLWHGRRVEGLIALASSRATAFDRFDLDLLSAVGNHLALALEQSRVQAAVLEQRLARSRLERYHSPAVVERIVAGGPGERLAEERTVTVLFADLVEFTATCERMTPRQVADWLNGCFEVMTEAVFRHEGTLDKFTGDGLMAVFGAPFEQPDHATRALRAAAEIRRGLRDLAGGPAGPARCRMGLHTGQVVAGDLGSRRRSDYTVVGRTVNTAARIESSVARAGQIVLSEETLRAAGPGFRTRALGHRTLRGIARPIACHGLIDG